MALGPASRAAHAGQEHGGKRGHHGMRGARRGGGMMMLRMADADGDKSITRAEFDAAQAAHFAKVDTNGDGTITAAERQTVHQAMRAEWTLPPKRARDSAKLLPVLSQ